MMDLPQQQERGRRAAELLESELLKEALKAIKDEVTEQWVECPARDKEGKEALWQLAKTAQKFENALMGYISTGKLATDQMKRFEEKRGISRLFGT
jgi:protein involved in temperature-dependent protein secretion